ncbi:MAG: FUSC family protein [Acetobacteraceae bacterium]
MAKSKLASESSRENYGSAPLKTKRHPRWARWPTAIPAWLDQVDPGTNRRIKGLRLVTAFGLAWMIATLEARSLTPYGHQASLGVLAAGFALWASVSEGQRTRAASTRDLFLLVFAAVAGALLMAGLRPPLATVAYAGPELTLVSGAFLAGYGKRFGVLSAGLGSQVFIGELLAYGARSTPSDVPAILLAGVIAAVSAIVPRLLSGPAEHPAVAPPLALVTPHPERRMGLQAAVAALVIVLVNNAVGLEESAWAVTACTYVIAGNTSETMHRVLRRIVGTTISVPLAIACLPLATHFPLLLWIAAALAMIVYAMALPGRYDIACGAYAFALIVTLASSGDTSVPMLLSRGWETVIGGALGLATALLLFPIPNRPAAPP